MRSPAKVIIHRQSEHLGPLESQDLFLVNSDEAHLFPSVEFHSFSAAKSRVDFSSKNQIIVFWLSEGSMMFCDSNGARVEINAGDSLQVFSGKGIEFHLETQGKTHPKLVTVVFSSPTRNEEPELYKFILGGRLSPQRWFLWGSAQGEGSSLTLKHKARMWLIRFDSEQASQKEISRASWIQVTKGSLYANGQLLGQGDGAAFLDQKHLVLNNRDKPAELLLIEC